MRASRLLSILLLLQNRGRMSAGALAEACGVSVRTVYRDIDALAAAGVPVYGEPGRAGGYALLEGFRTRLTGLTADEAGALFLSGLPGPAADLGLGSLLAAAELKVLASLPPSLRAGAELARERFLLDAPGWFREVDRPPSLAALAAAAWEQRPVRLRYAGRDGGQPRERVVEPLGLVLKAGVWYLVAAAAGAARTYRASRVEAVEPLNGRFERPAGFDLAAYWRTAADAFAERLYAERAVVRLSPNGLAALAHLPDPWVARVARASAGPPDGEGWVRVTLPMESAEIAAGDLLRLGPEAEALEPPELRRLVAAAARATAARYDEA
jgi:predicted DNA-binding transcriptional regulator YafY